MNTKCDSTKFTSSKINTTQFIRLAMNLYEQWPKNGTLRNTRGVNVKILPIGNSIFNTNMLCHKLYSKIRKGFGSFIENIKMELESIIISFHPETIDIGLTA